MQSRVPMPPSSTAAPFCAAARGSVSAATLKRTLRGWTAPAHGWAARRRFGPPSARQRARTDAAPSLSSPPPQGGTAVGTGAAVLCPCTASSRPHPPRTGALPIAALLDGGGSAAAACPSVCFPPSFQGFALDGGGRSGVKAWPATALRLVAPGTGAWADRSSSGRWSWWLAQRGRGLAYSVGAMCPGECAPVGEAALCTSGTGTGVA